MYRVVFKWKSITIIYDDAKDYGDYWSLQFYDVWHNFDKHLIKSVTNIKNISEL